MTVIMYGAPHDNRTVPYDWLKRLEDREHETADQDKPICIQRCGLTEADIRRIIREELWHLRTALGAELGWHDVKAGRTAPLNDVLCRLGDAYLLDEHPQNNVAGAD